MITSEINGVSVFRWVYSFSVNYDRRIEDYVIPGLNIDSQINSKKFLSDRKKKGKRTFITMDLVKLFGCEASQPTFKVIPTLNNLGFYLANIYEVLSFAESYVEEAKDFPIICLGSTLKKGIFSREKFCPVLFFDEDKHSRKPSPIWKLYLENFDISFSPFCRFAAISKSPHI
jgi:hypothetical protein